MKLIPISHRCTELEGRKWKEVFPRSIHDKRLTGELETIRKKQRLSLIDRRKTSFYSLPSNSVHRCEMGIK